MNRWLEFVPEVGTHYARCPRCNKRIVNTRMAKGSHAASCLKHVTPRSEWRGCIERVTGDEPSQMRPRLPYPGGEIGKRPVA